MSSAFGSGAAHRFEAVMSRAPIGAALVAKGGRFLCANNALRDIVGAPSIEALLSMSVYDSGSYKSEQVRSLVKYVEDGGAELNFDAEWVSSWGKQVSVRMFVAKQTDSGGELVYQIFYEDRLKNLPERDSGVWNLMLDSSINEFYVIDRSTLKHLYASQRSIDQLGYSLSELLDMTPADLFPDSSEHAIRSKYLSPLTTDTCKALSSDAYFKRKDGSLYPVDMVIQSTIYQGKPAYLVIAHDISETIATNAALTQAQTFLSAAPDPTVIVDKAKVIVFANARTEALLGYSRNKLVGMGIEQLWSEAAITLEALFDQDLPASQGTDSEDSTGIKHLIHQNGSLVPVETSLSKIHTNDGSLIAIAYRNISGRLEIEAALKSAKELAEHAEQTKSQLLAAASHDLRQPTQSLSQYSWLLGQVATTPEQKELAKNIQASVDSIADLLNVFLDISKLDSGVIRPAISEFDITTLSTPILSNFGPAARAKGISLRCDGEPFLVRSDPALILRILENLVSNAVRYTRTGGVIVSWTKVNESLLIKVTDTGIGIDKEKVGQIFDEHFQIEGATSAQTKGLGLGLSIVQRISQLLGLRVDVCSTLSNGSEFSLTLPIVATKAATKEARDTVDPLPTDDDAPKVLLIDDEPAVLKSTKLVLERHHCTVHTAHTAENAMEQLVAGIRPDILVTDYRLPGFSGTELVQRARMALGHDVPAVIVTGDMSGAAIKTDNLASVQVLHKPTNLKQLISTITELTH